MEEKPVHELNLTTKNPRRLMQQTSEMMDRTIDEFGSLDGIVYNASLKELVGGNQRTIKFQSDPNAVVRVTKRLEQPTHVGSIAYGYVSVNGERWPYREVWWDESKHKRAVIAANAVHASWDDQLLAETVYEISEVEPDMLDTLGFEEESLKNLLEEQSLSIPKEEKEDRDSKKTGKYNTEQLRLIARSYGENVGAILAFLDFVDEQSRESV